MKEGDVGREAAIVLLLRVHALRELSDEKEGSNELGDEIIFHGRSFRVVGSGSLRGGAAARCLQLSEDSGQLRSE